MREHRRKYPEKHKTWRKNAYYKDVAASRKYQRDYKREVWRFHQYGITKEQWAELSKGGCALCLTGKGLCLDHDHVTGQVRGVLCRRCNSALGKLGDSIVGLRRALVYLRLGRAATLKVA